MKKNKIIRVLGIIVIVLLVCVGCDKNDIFNNINDSDNSNSDSNMQNTSNDLEKLKEILKQEAFGNFDQSVENYFEGYLGPIVDVMVKNNFTTIENLKVEDLTEEDIAEIICLTVDYKMTSIYPHYEGQEKINYPKSEVVEIVKKYFNINNYSFSKFTNSKEYEWSDSSINLEKDGTLVCTERYASQTIEVTDVVYNQETQKVLVYIDAIEPGQAGASNIDFAGTIELKYNDGNFNVISLNFENVTN